MTTRQLVLAVVLLALACCAIMWWLESFRQRKMIDDFRAMLDRLPTAGEGTASS